MKQWKKANDIKKLGKVFADKKGKSRNKILAKSTHQLLTEMVKSKTNKKIKLCLCLTEKHKIACDVLYTAGDVLAPAVWSSSSLLLLFGSLLSMVHV